jgi:hypothetical protein
MFYLAYATLVNMLLQAIWILMASTLFHAAQGVIKVGASLCHIKMRSMRALHGICRASSCLTQFLYSSLHPLTATGHVPTSPVGC